MADLASERIRIDATPERCLEVALDYEHYPDWARDVKQVTVVERDDDGRGITVEYRAAALGKSAHYTLGYDYAALPESFSWKLLKGDIMKRLDGTYRFEPDGDGCRVHYDLAVDLAIPLPGIIKRRGAGMIVGTALKGLKQAIEKANG